MPTYYIDIPLMNPFNFVDKNRELPLNYNFKHFDGWTDREQQLFLESKKCYIQPWQNDDIAFLQFKANFSPIRLQIRKDTGEIVLSQVMSIVNTIADAVYFQSQIAFDSFDEGDYTLEVLAGDPILITLQTEKFNIKSEQERTLLFKYWNSFNNNILWENRNYMLFRVNGVIPYDEPISVRTVYIDQPGSAQTVKGDAARKFKLYIGCDGGLPKWVIDKMDEIVDQNSLEIDGKGFAPVPGTTWSTKKIDRYPWAQWTLDMRETSNKRFKRFEIDGIQDKKVVVEYIVETRLFGPVNGAAANDNTYTINVLD